MHGNVDIASISTGEVFALLTGLWYANHDGCMLQNSKAQAASVFNQFQFISILSCIDNILDDKPDGKSSADKEEQPADEIPKRMKKAESASQSKGKVEM